MKRFVNGEEVELGDSSAEVTALGNKLMVRTSEGTFSALAVRDGDRTLVSYRGQTYTIEKGRRTASLKAAGSGEMRAPMPGLIVDVIAAQGEAVQKGDKILVLEAMKTQQAFTAPFDGTVREIKVSKGDQVIDGQLLAVVIVAGVSA
ncbi:MAG: biotin/lipoyl-containing protein [Fimbriimonadaceae bacterium]